MASKSETKKSDGQIGTELDQLEAAAGVTEVTTGYVVVVEPPPPVEVKEYPPIVRKQANRLLRLFQLQPGHEGRAERIAEYQLALSQNGVKNPPVDIETAYALIREVGEYHG